MKWVTAHRDEHREGALKGGLRWRRSTVSLVIKRLMGYAETGRKGELKGGKVDSRNGGGGDTKARGLATKRVNIG